jgi:hypothetical protein
MVAGRGLVLLLEKAFKLNLRPCFSIKGFKALAQARYLCSLRCNNSLYIRFHPGG